VATQIPAAHKTCSPLPAGGWSPWPGK